MASLQIIIITSDIITMCFGAVPVSLRRFFMLSVCRCFPHPNLTSSALLLLSELKMMVCFRGRCSAQKTSSFVSETSAPAREIRAVIWRVTKPRLAERPAVKECVDGICAPGHFHSAWSCKVRFGHFIRLSFHNLQY